MTKVTPPILFLSLVYGGGAALLSFDLLFMSQAAAQGRLVPAVLLVASMLTAFGLLLVIYAEYHTRAKDRHLHRRLARVAHQLVHPLRVLQEDIQLLADRAAQLPPEGRLKLKQMETRTRVLLENLRDVFLVLEAQQGPITKEHRVYNLCTLVRDSVERSRPFASARNVELISQMHCEHAPVRVDRQFFFIAVQHLVNNGVIYTLTPGLVNVAVVKGNREARVVVQDRGIGIRTAAVETLFQPFVRGEKAEQFDADGVGVGLTLARQIVREFGGELAYVHRAAKAGSEFQIRLPIAS